MKLVTLYVNAKREIPLGAVLVRSALGRAEDGTTLDHGLLYYFTNRAEATAAGVKVALAVPGIDCTIKEYDDDLDHPLDGDGGRGRL